MAIAKEGDLVERTRITRLFTFAGLDRDQAEEARAGDIVCLAGVDGIGIGDTITDAEEPSPLPRLRIDEPTLSMVFSVNSSPFSGLDGEHVTSRKLKERLEKELLTNISLQLQDTDTTDSFRVFGRGELQLAILVETMRREGYELALSNPEVIVKEIDGVKKEPFEVLLVDVAETFQGVVVEKLGIRKGILTHMVNHGSGRVRLQFRVPSRGLIGIRSEILADTRGTAVMNALFDGFDDWQGSVPKRLTGALVADRRGRATAYALHNLEDRGELFIGSGDRGLRRNDRRREREGGRSRRERHAREEAHQHEGLDLGHRRPAHSPPRAQPRAGHRVHSRRRAGRSDAALHSAPEEDPRLEPASRSAREE